MSNLEDLNVVSLGDVIERFKGVEGSCIDIDDLGINFYFIGDKLMQEEIDAYKTGDIKLGLLYMKDIIFIFTKFGLCPWNESPFLIQLAANWDNKRIDDEYKTNSNIGIGLTSMAIESKTGEIKTMRLYGTPNRFTRDLSDMIEKQKNNIYESPEEYNKVLASIMNAYTTKELIKFAKVY